MTSLFLIKNLLKIKLFLKKSKILVLLVKFSLRKINSLIYFFSFIFSWFFLFLLILFYYLNIVKLSKKNNSNKISVLIGRNTFRDQRRRLPSPEEDWIDYWLKELGISTNIFLWDTVNSFTIQFKFFYKILIVNPDLIILSCYSKIKLYPSLFLLKYMK